MGEGDGDSGQGREDGLDLGFGQGELGQEGE